MLTVVSSKSVEINNRAFKECEVEYNLVFRILEDEKALVIQSPNQDFIAVQNEGRAMWIWINPNLNEVQVNDYLTEFYELIKERQIPGIAGYKGIIEKIAMKLSLDRDNHYKPSMGMIAYYCPKVNWKDTGNVNMIQSKATHINTISVFLRGFVKDAFGNDVTRESHIEKAKNLTGTGNLYLLEVDGKIVSMANIAHKTERYGRINLVYTPVEHRNNGYASALVAKVSAKLLDEGLIPVLFTDDSNDISNRVYTNIGYRETGRIDNLTLSD